jgi:hypothetical protein
MLDWAPCYYFGLDDKYFTLTKLVVLPLIVMDFFIKPASYLSGKDTRYGRIYLFCLLLGAGGGVADGNVAMRRLVELLPTVMILMFYLKIHSRDQVKYVIHAAFIISIVVPINLLLVHKGILSPSDINYLGREGELTRIWAGTTSSTLGLYILFPAATVGGLLLKSSKAKAILTSTILAGFTLIIGFVATILTGQRGVLLVYIIIVISGILIYCSYRKMSYVRRMLLTLFVGAIYLTVYYGELETMATGLVYRWHESLADPVTGGIVQRTDFWLVLIRDLMYDPHIIAPGMGSVIGTLGIGSHLILGEAYYDGGLILMLALIYGLVQAGRNTWTEFRKDNPLMGAPIGAVLILLFFGFFMILSFEPGLHTRLFYMVLGLCISTRSTLVPSNVVVRVPGQRVALRKLQARKI